MRTDSSSEAKLHEADLQARREERDLEDRRLELLKARLSELREQQQAKMQLKLAPSR
jgi:hypothetical protein